jgi:FAD/FMN-containing dehydrogenase
MQNHKHAVEKIAASVQDYFRRREPFRIYHGSTNSTRQTVYRRGNMVDTSALSRVLKIDAKARTVLVEPNVPMDRLVESTIRRREQLVQVWVLQ